MHHRRDFLKNIIGVGLAGVPVLLNAQHEGHTMTNMQPGSSGSTRSPERQGRNASVMVETPDVPDLPFRLDGGVKEFRLIAQPVKQELLPGMVANLWGFNGTAPGPTIQVDQGDRVRIIVDNQLPEPFSMHWHGFEIPHNMDGAPGTSQDPILPGKRFVYEFTLHQEGTFFYHTHMAMQEMFGMIGAFIMHPRKSYQPRADKDFAIILQEYAILPNNPVPNSMNMEFNWLTFNGKSGPAITPMIVRLGDRVRIRLINLGMDHHPIHLHGHTFAVTGTEGGRQPQAVWGPANTVLVGVAQARDIEFVANNPGDWMFHCHLPHHMMNAMSSNVGPMTRMPGMPMGQEMDLGMGIPTMGSPRAPLSDEYGPSLGRGLGVGSTNDQPTSNGPQSQERMMQAMPGMQHQGMQMPMGHQMQQGDQNQKQSNPPAMQHEQMQQGEAEIAPNANRVPGFPQDAYMEGRTMAMDKMVDKPENYGLRPGWSGFMQGMMTFVRVLPADMYDKIMELRRQKRPQQPMPGMEHDHRSM